MIFKDFEVLKVKIYFKIISITLLTLVVLLKPYNTIKNNDIKIRSGKTKLTSFVFDNFSQNEYSYNHKLAQKSLELAVSAFSSKESMKMWGENTYCGREADVENKLISYGFSDIEFFDYNISLNDYSSKCAFAVGKANYNSEYDIFAVVIRGGRYGLEWADNFNVGSKRLIIILVFILLLVKLKSN